jgi:hypothetical protein
MGQEVHTRAYVAYVGVVRHVVSVNPCSPTMVAIMKEGGQKTPMMWSMSDVTHSTKMPMSSMPALMDSYHGCQCNPEPIAISFVFSLALEDWVTNRFNVSWGVWRSTSGSINELNLLLWTYYASMFFVLFTMWHLSSLWNLKNSNVCCLIVGNEWKGPSNSHIWWGLLHGVQP